ncbi:transport protein YajR [Escherichia coli]|nr:transport protein YajR [Escherichia coli]
MVKGSFSKVLAEPRLLKLNFGIMCLHILLMSTFVALPGQLADAGSRRLNTGRSTWQRC